MKELLCRLDSWDRVASRRLILPADTGWRWLPSLGAHLGDGALWLIVALTMLLGGTAAARRATMVAVAAVLFSMGVATIIKYIVRRPRPHDRHEFYALRYDRYAFPSGHATRMGAIAVVIGQLEPHLAIPGYALAMTVALCRVLVGVHYLSDVLGGLLIGLVGANVAMWWLGDVL